MNTLLSLSIYCRKQAGIVLLVVLSFNLNGVLINASTSRFYKKIPCPPKCSMSGKRRHDKRLNGKPSLTQALVRRSSGTSGAMNKTIVVIDKDGGKEAT